MLGYKAKKLDEQKISIDNVVRYCNVDLSETGIHIELGGDLVCASGIGASAASCVALARSLDDEFSLGLNNDQINEAAFEGEKGYHGTPSGIDNTASAFGGLVWYIRNLEGGPPTFEKLKLKKPAHLVIASTGITASTIEVVEDVKAKKDENPEWFDKIAREYENLVHSGRDALLQLDFSKVGKLMNKNHELLQELTVSCEELDALTKVARENGALGSKMTGTGRGGNMISLAPDEASRDRIAKTLEQAGAAGVWITSFGL